MVDLDSLKREVVLQNCTGLICSDITEKASETSIAQMDGVYVHLKLQKNTKTFGFMYSLLQDLKTKYPIKEYSCN